MSNTLNFHTKHFVVIGLSLIVFMGLLLVDKTTIQSSKSSSVQNTDNRNSNAKLTPLDEDSQKVFDQLESKLKNENLPSKKIEILNQLVSLSLEKKLLDYAIHYQKQLVEFQNDDANVSKLGDLALMSLDNVSLDSTQYFVNSQLALRSFAQLVNKDNQNDHWKVKLAVAKVKSKDSSKIMEGIKDLVEITQKNENHFEANYYLGYFSLESNQPEKALKRFEKCLKLQPKNPEVFMGLGESYQRLNKNDEAIKHYEAALKYSTNEFQKKKIESKLELLKH